MRREDESNVGFYHIKIAPHFQDVGGRQQNCEDEKGGPESDFFFPTHGVCLLLAHRWSSGGAAPIPEDNDPSTVRRAEWPKGNMGNRGSASE